MRSVYHAPGCCGCLEHIPWSPAVEACLGCAFFARLEAPGLGIGLSSTSYSQMPQDLASSLRYCHFWPPLPGPFSALYLSRIMGLRSRAGHGSLFEMERKKKQREKAQHLHVSLHVLSHKASHSECELGAKGLYGFWGR